MLPRFADNVDPRSLASRLRRQRLRWVGEMLDGVDEPVRVLDVGGSVAFWNNAGRELLPRCHVTVLNLTVGPATSGARIVTRMGDGRRMPEIGDHAFDLCFSNSVIEHAGALPDQMAMAAEIRRVARGYFVQTPYRHFPIEPHFLFPAWQYLPVSLRVALFQRFRLGWMGRQPDAERARVAVEQVRLLDCRTLRALFPDSSLREERIGPLIKSIVAFRRPT